MAGGDFTKLGAYKMDEILAQDPGGFMSLLFTHAIEGMYSVPEYGGNKDLVGWHEISWPGDRQPIGYTDKEVTYSDGPDAMCRRASVSSCSSCSRQQVYDQTRPRGGQRARRLGGGDGARPGRLGRHDLREGRPTTSPISTRTFPARSSRTTS